MKPPVVDYFFTPQSPWTYLGHERFVALVREAGVQPRVRPADFGQVFAGSGGLPLAKRAPQRQAYRLVELARFRDHLGLPLNLQPRHFPVAGDDAARLIIAADQLAGVDAALGLTGAILRAVWAQDRHIADAATLAQLLAEQGLPAHCLEHSRAPAVQAAYDAHTQAAMAAGVFGAPSYVIGDEIFWGQDRLDFVRQRLQART